MKVVTFDPGESTGYSIWQDGDLVYAGTAELDAVVEAFGAALLDHSPEWLSPADPALQSWFAQANHVVIEDWALYPWEVQNLAWDKCRTARAIGALEFICGHAGVPYTLQPAKIKDRAVAAGAEELFLRPLHENRHANDAIMHGTVFKLQEGAGAAA